MLILDSSFIDGKSADYALNVNPHILVDVPILCCPNYPTMSPSNVRILLGVMMLYIQFIFGLSLFIDGTKHQLLMANYISSCINGKASKLYTVVDGIDHVFYHF